jgi:opacity protein-like surface antigen
MFRSFLQYLVLGFVFTAVAHAEPVVTSGSAGNYLGMQLGISKMHGQEKYLPDSGGTPVLTKPSDKGFAMRMYWGYQFVDYLAIESGYGYLSPETYNIPNGNSPELRMQMLDFLGKGILPLWWGFNVYGKVGAALVFYNQGGLLAPNPAGKSGSSGMTMRPEIGAGVSYSFNPNWSVDFSGTRIMKGGAVPDSDMLTISFTYHAVDLYCGQFLC